MRQLNLVAAMTVEALVERDLCRKNASSLFDQPTQTHFIADGAFDWDGYALVGIAPGLYKKETDGRREGSFPQVKHCLLRSIEQADCHDCRIQDFAGGIDCGRTNAIRIPSGEKAGYKSLVVL